ncbi:lytic transglycosylase domain-containing protein [Citroniella saccharovorans]|uniref:Lytic transglycosylase domain-containing protein n=1 Tax=Citroniella saccharovorans TaxID=2053367 RepID=A0AAW9MTR5_9FIRM|nr:lytic transglycosylase domain-containing protein [Citroniella saccharovorans]MEB3429451.1 lytic transglycosylase domain-containing protein [Citroniella saccharovorans]
MKALKAFLIGILSLVFVLFLISFGTVFFKTTTMKIEYEDLIHKYAEEYDVDELMIASIINVESGFDKDAHSHMDAKGLMQIVDETGKWISEQLGEDYSFEKLVDPDMNIRYGTYYYKYLLDHFQTKELALAAYNGGIGNVEKWLEDENISPDGVTLKNIPFEETKNYVEKVENSYNQYSLFYGDHIPEENNSKNIMKLAWKNYKTFLKDLVK